jgi:hypothetical protein
MQTDVQIAGCVVRQIDKQPDVQTDVQTDAQAE